MIINSYDEKNGMNKLGISSKQKSVIKGPHCHHCKELSSNMILQSYEVTNRTDNQNIRYIIKHYKCPLCRSLFHEEIVLPNDIRDFLNEITKLYIDRHLINPEQVGLNNKKDNINTLVISAFPGCGKTYIVDQLNFLIENDPYEINEYTGIMNCTTSIIDLDSSKFHHTHNTEDDEDYKWEEEYVNYIKSFIGKVNIIFISTHSEVRRLLKNQNIKYTVVIPDNNTICLGEWVKRFSIRGNDNDFIYKVVTSWNKWLSDIMRNEEDVVCLNDCEYLSDVIKELYLKNNRLKDKEKLKNKKEEEYHNDSGTVRCIM